MKADKKSLALIISVFILIAFSIVYVVVSGSHYSMNTNVWLSVDEPYYTEVEFDRDGVVEAERFYMDGEVLMVDFKAVGSGETTVYMKFQADKDSEIYPISERVLKVNSLGVITEHSFGSINFSGFMAVVIAVLISLGLTELVMLLKFIEYRRKGDFSYSMVACGGAAIYIFILLLFLIYKLLNNVVNTFGAFVANVSDTGSMLLLALLPVMLVISVLLMLSNIWLMRHEGRRPVNALGIVFGVLWFVGTLLTIGPSLLPEQMAVVIPRNSYVSNVLVYVIAYFECMFLSTSACAYLATRYLPDYDRDYIIILGCGIRGDGSLTPLLKGRVDSAIAFERAQYDAEGKHAVFVPSGGQGADEVISESGAMKRYLTECGIPGEQILCENKSVNTNENMRFSKEVIENDGGDIGDKKIAFATTNYHIFRGYILAKKNGFDAKGISAKTKAYFYPNAFLREFIGLLVDKKWSHLLFIALILLFFFGVLM